MTNKVRWPGYYFVMLIGFGVSNLGNWIYLIALNVFVWRLTESPAAVAGIYVVGPVVRIFCNLIVGSVIDRLNKKNLVIGADIARAVFVGCMPFADSIVVVYVLIGLTNVASTFFGPSSTYLISTLIKQEHRLRFNSLNSMNSSGSFMIGPAIGGVIIAVAPIAIAMWVNAASFLLCALLLAFIPDLEEKKPKNADRQSIWQLIKGDYQLVYAFSKKNVWFSRFLVVYSFTLMIAFALDSQEMPFLISVLHISEGLYGVSVTVAGIGAILGGVCAAALCKKYSVSTYIKVGFSVTLLSYLVFYSAHAYWLAMISFVALGFFMAFSNSGYASYYQETVEPAIMGRFSSGVQLMQALLQVLLTLLIGFLCEAFSLQLMTAGFAAIGFIFSLFILIVPNREFEVRETL